MRPTITALLLAVCALACEPPRARDGNPPVAEVWVVARESARRPTPRAPADPALAARPPGSSEAPTAIAPTATRIGVTVVGPVSSTERRSVYTTPREASDGFVLLTLAPAPVSQDVVVTVDGRRILLRVRDRETAARLADARTLRAGADGRVMLPIGRLPAAGSVEVGMQTVGIVGWNDGAYELTVPGAVAGAVALTVDIHGDGPLVVVSSPSHAIDTEATSLRHVRVRPREADAVRADDFVLRYRIDSAGHPGTLLTEPDGDGTLVVLVLHPCEHQHEPVGLANVRVDWGTMQVTDVRPALPTSVAPGMPLVLFAHARGAAVGPVTVTARAGREPRTVTVARDEEAPATSLRALAALWALADGR